MTPHEFEQRLQQCWDQRRDPADDAQLCAWLLEHPDALEEFAARRERIETLAALPVTPRRRTPTVVAALAATLAAAAGLLVWCRSSEGAPVGRILSATLESTRSAGQGTVTWQEREILCATPDARLEIIQRRSERR